MIAKMSLSTITRNNEENDFSRPDPWTRTSPWTDPVFRKLEGIRSPEWKRTRDPGDLAVGVEEDERSGRRCGRRSRGRVGLHPVSWPRLKGSVVADDHHRGNYAQMRKREEGGWLGDGTGTRTTEKEHHRLSREDTSRLMGQTCTRGLYPRPYMDA